MHKKVPIRLLGVFLLLSIPSLSYCCLSFDSFTATVPNNCEVNLAWTFEECREVGVYYVEYSTDGGNSFGIINTINSTGGGSDAVSYTYTDNAAHPPSSAAATLIYRIVFVLTSPQRAIYSPVVLTQVGASTCNPNNSSRCSGVSGLSINGPSAICAGSNGTYTLNNSSFLIDWSITSGSSLVTSSTSLAGAITITNSSNSSQAVIMLATNVEGCDPLFFPIVLGIPPTPTQMFPNPTEENVPPGGIAEFNSPGASFWPQPVNGTITAGQGGDDVAVRVANVQSGSLVVKAEARNACGTSAALTESFAIVPGSPQPFSIHPDSLTAVAKTVDLVVSSSAVKVGLYPNPARNSVQVVIPAADYTKAFVRLYDMNGRLLRMVVPTGQQTQIDVSHQAKGTYLLEIYDGKQMTSQKLVLQ